MTAPRYIGPPEWQFGLRLGLFIASLPLDNDEVLWWVVRFVDVVGNEHEPLRPKHEAFGMLRRRIAALIPAAKVKELDEILDAPEWKEPSSMSYFTSGYYGSHRPLGSDFWRWFRLAGFENMMDFHKQSIAAEMDRKGIDVWNG